MSVTPQQTSQVQFAPAGPAERPVSMSMSESIPDIEGYQKIYITNGLGSASTAMSSHWPVGNTTSTLAGMLEEDILIASKHLMKALLLRKRYAAFAMHGFPRRTTNVLEAYDALFPADSKLAAIEALERPIESTRKTSVHDLSVNPDIKESKYNSLSPAEIARTAPPSPLVNEPHAERLFGGFAFCMQKGVLQIYELQADGEQLTKLDMDAWLFSFSEYMTHLRKLTRYTADGPLKVRRHADFHFISNLSGNAFASTNLISSLLISFLAGLSFIQ